MTAKIREDMESVLVTYDIADKASQRQYLGSLTQLSDLAGQYDAALASAEAIRKELDHP